jgi:hypothetical protein
MIQEEKFYYVPSSRLMGLIIARPLLDKSQRQVG